MNTRLQVEHPVTEQVTGVDLVRAQLLVAVGRAAAVDAGRARAARPRDRSRVYAEDPAQGFLPQAGPLLLYREPRWPGVRVDSGVAEGDEVSVHYDPLLAKLIATAETRDLAIARLDRRAARVSDPRHPHQHAVPASRSSSIRAFRAGAVDTGFLDREGAGDRRRDGGTTSVRQSAAGAIRQIDAIRDRVAIRDRAIGDGAGRRHDAAAGSVRDGRHRCQRRGSRAPARERRRRRVADLRSGDRRGALDRRRCRRR